MSDAPALPDRPNEWAEHPDGFLQRWMPGAFGDRGLIHGVVAFKVLEDEWHEDDDGTIRRTITKAEIVNVKLEFDR